MKRLRLLLAVLLVLGGLLYGAWATYVCFNGQLFSVQITYGHDTSIRTEDQDFLRRVEAWYRALERPSLKRRLEDRLDRLLRWDCEAGLRQRKYEVTLTFRGGRRERLRLWIYGEHFMPVHWQGHSCLARYEPFTELVETAASGQVTHAD